MTKKECFINEVKAAIDGLEERVPENYFSPDALDYWNSLNSASDGKPKFTTIGKVTLRFMQENKDTYNNIFKAKEIGEALGISSRSVSGGMKKLVNDGYVEKMGDTPVIYAITALGLAAEVKDAEG